MCQSVFLFKIHKKQFFHEIHKGKCTILCSPPDLYGTSDGWGAQSGAVRRGVHISKKKCHPYGWHLRLSKNDKTQSCNRAAGRKDFFDTLKCHPYGWHFIGAQARWIAFPIRKNKIAPQRSGGRTTGSLRDSYINKKHHPKDGVFLWQAAPIKISAVFLVFSMVSAFWGKVFGACCFILLVAAVQPKKILWDLWNFVRSARFCQRSPL